MNIWVDADACPVAIKEILFRAAKRTGLQLTLVANLPMRVPKATNINTILVPSGFDIADNEIVKQLVPGDLVITADIPLAAEVLEKGAQALNPRGELYEPDTIKERLRIRDAMESLRNDGIKTGGPAALGPSDRNRFANQLDKILSTYLRTRNQF